MYIPESPYNLVSEGKFYKKGFYLDAKENVIHNGKEIIANCPRLLCVNVCVLETHPDNNTIGQNTGYLLVAAKRIASSFEIWHKRLLHAGEETVLRTMKAMDIEGKKPESWSYEPCMLAKPYKQISREVPFQSKEACAELYTDTIPVKPQGFGGYNYFMTIIDSATMYTWVVFLVQKAKARQKLQEFVRWLEKQSAKTVKVIVRDGGKEYSPKSEGPFTREMGIDVHESAPRTPEQNGKAKVSGRHILEMA